MDKSIRIYHSHDEMKADEYRYWQNRPMSAKLAAGRPQDIADVAALRKTAEAQKSDKQK